MVLLFRSRMVLLIRVQHRGNYRDFMKASDVNSPSTSSEENNAIFTFSAQDNDTSTIRVAAFNSEAIKYKDIIKVSKNFFWLYQK